MKKWKERIGSLHIGQLIIAEGVALFAALQMYVVGAVVLIGAEPGTTGPLDVLAFLSLIAAPFTVVGCIVVLWIWFGARRKS